MRCDLKRQDAGVDDPKLLGPVYPGCHYLVSPSILVCETRIQADTYCILGSTTPPRSLGSIAVLPTQWLAPTAVLVYHANHSESVPLGPIGGSKYGSATTSPNGALANKVRERREMVTATSRSKASVRNLGVILGLSNGLDELM